MRNNVGRKTGRAYWEATSQDPIRNRLPSRFNVNVLNLTRLLRRYVSPGSRYIEIGCAPGKMLAWVASVLKAEANGLDFSGLGIAKCRALFDALGLEVNLYHEDILNHHLPLSFFDFVTSFGVIEHFDDARPVVQAHLDLVKPGGLSLITVPNYSGIYGWLQRSCNALNFSLHNPEIMNTSSLAGLADSPGVKSVRAYHFGSMSPWFTSLDKRLPSYVAKLVSLGVNTAGLFQPFTIEALAPLLVLEVRKCR